MGTAARAFPAQPAAVRAHLPVTLRLEAADRARLAAEQADWVLKSDYGCEGEEVIIGRQVPASEWRACLDQALPRRWIAQRYFQARQDAAGEIVNHGVYLVAGAPPGCTPGCPAGRPTSAPGRRRWR